MCSLIKLFYCNFKVLFYPFHPKYSAKKLDFGCRVKQTVCLNSGPIPGIPGALDQLSTLSAASLPVPEFFFRVLVNSKGQMHNNIYYLNCSVNSDSYFIFSHGKSHISGSRSPFNVRIFNENYLRNPHKSNFSSTQNV